MKKGHEASSKHKRSLSDKIYKMKKKYKEEQVQLNIANKELYGHSISKMGKKHFGQVAKPRRASKLFNKKRAELHKKKAEFVSADLNGWSEVSEGEKKEIESLDRHIEESNAPVVAINNRSKSAFENELSSWNFNQESGSTFDGDDGYDEDGELPALKVTFKKRIKGNKKKSIV